MNPAPIVINLEDDGGGGGGGDDWGEGRGNGVGEERESVCVSERGREMMEVMRMRSVLCDVACRCVVVGRWVAWSSCSAGYSGLPVPQKTKGEPPASAGGLSNLGGPAEDPGCSC